MQRTPSDKSQMSSGLKDRLKRCGRYHMSPYSSRPPEMKTPSCPERKSDVSGSPLVLPENPSKRICTGLDKCNETPVKSYEGDDVTHNISESPLNSLNCNQSNRNNVLEPVSNFSSQNETPNCRRKSESLRIKGNKLSFESESRSENLPEVEQVNDEISSCHDKEVHTNQVVENDTSKTNYVTMTESLVLKELSAREETLRKLKMVKMYRSKNNLAELQTLIDKWRDVSQQALQDLHEAMPEPKPTLTQLINHLGIVHELVRFKSENDEENFY